MARLRILSWNIRTFGTHEPHPEDLRNIAEIIGNSQADIVCIQELMIGRDVVGEVGARISQQSLDIVQALAAALAGADPGADWVWACSGVDSGIADHMRDAYAFLVKTAPATSKFAHAEAPDGITCLGWPVILRQPVADHFPGRRPGMLSVLVRAAKDVTLVNVVSYHAPTPCNRFSKGIGSGYGINALATLPEIGGGLQQSNGHAWRYVDQVMPLPQLDTVVVGDFNYTMDDYWANFTYCNLLTNYQACISAPGNVHATTYAPDSTQGLRLISAYDNIFVLRAHDKFKPSLTFVGGSVIDFIHDQAARLGAAIGFYPPDISTAAAWYVVHQDAYKNQHGVRGISDHAPVWAEFDVGGGGSTAAHIQPTGGANNNCLFNAVFGALDAGVYIDPLAAAKRAALVNTLDGYRLAGVIPADGAMAPARAAILGSMLEDFAATPLAAAMLRHLIENPGVNPFTIAGFPDDLFGGYMANIAGGRMMYVNEAQLLASIHDITIVLHRFDRGQYFEDTFNPGRANPVHIFHQALHFSRWIP